MVPYMAEVRPTSLSGRDCPMTITTMAFPELAEKRADIEVLRQMVKFIAQRLTELDGKRALPRRMQ